MKLFKSYYSALKPERAYANVMTTGAGYLFASKWHVHWITLLATLLGTTFVVMSACAVNNCTDRELDRRMPRTKHRPSATGRIPITHLVFLAVVLGVTGFIVLIVKVNVITVVLGILGYIDYVVFYAWTKRKTVWSTLIGTISGSVPIMAGYTAVTGSLTGTAFLLGLVMLFWQMSHFYAIGIFRVDDYRLGKLPIWPVTYSVRNTQIWILAYTICYLIAVAVLAYWGSLGAIFTITAGLMGLYWVYLGIKGFRATQPNAWARGMFGFSLLVVVALSFGLAVSPMFP